MSRVKFSQRGMGDDDEPLRMPIEMKPGFSASLFPNSTACKVEGYHIDIDSDNDVLNAYHDPNSESWRLRQEEFGDGIALDIPEVSTDEEIAFAVLVSRITSEFHEEFEWVKLNGKRLAEPHPSDNGMWGWLYGKIHALASEYAERYPIGEQL